MKPRILSTARLSFALASALAALLAAPAAHATDLYWDVDGTTPGFSTVVGAWNTGLFWNNDPSGGAGTVTATTTAADDLFVPQATTATGSITLTGAKSASSITFLADTGPTVTITGGGPITIGGTGAYQGIRQQSSGANTISTALTLNSAVSAFDFSNSSTGLLTIGAVTGAVTSGTQTITVGSSAAGGITLNGIIGNGAGGGTVALKINSSGAGITTLSGANSFTGQLSVERGVLSINTIANAATNGTLGASTSAVPVILGSSGGNTGTLQYTGATVTSTKPFTLASGGTGAFDVTVGANTLTLSGLIKGDGGLSKTGAGTLVLSNAANQFIGPISISGGKLNLGNQYGMWQSAYDTTGSTGAIGLNATGQANPWLGGLAGSVDLATAITGYGSVTSLNLNPQSGSSVSYGGVIANGSGAMSLNKTGHGTQTLTGANTYSGATTVWAGTLSLAGASGTALNSAFTVRGGTVELDNSGGAFIDRLADGTALSLGSLTLKSYNGAGVQSEAVGATTFAVGGKVTINNGTTGGDQTTLAMGAVTRSAGAAIDFVGTGGTLGGGANSPNVTSTGAFPSASNGILPWATVGGTQWAEDNGGSIRAYTGTFVDPTTAASDATKNAQLSGSGSIGSAKSFNSLNVIATGAGQSLNLNGNLTLTSGNGAILKSGAEAYTISATTGNITAGNQLIAHVNGGALTISAPLNTAILNIAKGGTGDLILSGTRSTNFTNAGFISIAGGQLEFRGASTTVSSLVTGAGGLTVNLNAGQTLTLGNGANTYAGPTIVKGGYLADSGWPSTGLPGGRYQTPGGSLIMSNLTLEGGVWYSKYTTNKDLGAGPGQVQILAGTSGFAHDASQGGAASLVLDGGREIVWGSTYFNPTAFVHNTTGNLTLNLANGFDLAGSTRTVLVGDATISTANGVSQLGGNIRNSTGTAGFTKTGIGTLLLSGTNTYNGATTISSGILRFQNQVSLYNNTPASWTAANIVVANNATFALNVGGTNQFTTGSVTTLLTNLGGANGTSTTGFAAGSSIGFDTTNAAGSTFTVADNIADSSGTGGGALGVVKLGSNTLVLSGASNSYSGATIIRGGTLSLTGSLTGNTAISTANNNNGGGGTVLNGILNQSAAGVISGATASFTQGSSGTSILAGDNSYGGGTTLNAGTLTVAHANALGTGTGTIRLNGGTIQSNDATARSFTNAVMIGGNFTVGGTGNMTFSNTGASALGATRTITVTTSTVNATFAQAFSGSTFGITKAGAGTLQLNGTNTYTGLTSVNAGTLGGTGSIAGAVTVAAAGSLAPGASAGTLSIGGVLNISAQANGGAGKLNFELGPIANSDKIALTGSGSLTIGSAFLDFSDFNFTALAGLQNGTYKLITSANAISGTLAVSGLSGSVGAGMGLLQITGNDVELVVSGISGGTPYETWAGPGVNFVDDANNDGVSNGLAFLLGASGPNVSALDKLPTVTESAGGLVLAFQMLDATARGTAVLKLEHSNSLATGSWTTVAVPDTSSTVDDVVFTVTGTGPLDVTGTIPVSKAAGGKLFGRLKAENP